MAFRKVLHSKEVTTILRRGGGEGLFGDGTVKRADDFTTGRTEERHLPGSE